jgi:hypothetical protein
VPRLHLRAEDDLELAGVRPARVDERLEHAVERARHLRAERAHVVHCVRPSGPARVEIGSGARTEDVERVRGVGSAGDDQRAQAGLESHGEGQRQTRVLGVSEKQVLPPFSSVPPPVLLCIQIHASFNSSYEQCNHV